VELAYGLELVWTAEMGMEDVRPRLDPFFLVNRAAVNCHQQIGICKLCPSSTGEAAVAGGTRPATF